MLDWLLSPIDPTRAHEVGAAISWHGRGMVLAWGFLLPLGVLAARFFKVMPGQDWPREIENPTWWLLHRLLQYSGLIVMALALSSIFLFRGETPGAWLHRWFGWSMVALTIVQFVAALAHGTKGGPRALAPDGTTFGDHYNMTRKRIVFEWTHKNLGYLLLAMSIVSVLTGLWISNALVFMWFGIVAWWVILALAFTLLQRAGRAVDTYQAIWGPDPAHPGNRRAPIGWGLRRADFDPSVEPESIRQRRLSERDR